MHTSFTVPHTASLPTFPPGKRHGETTKLSVENTGCEGSAGSTAPSPSRLSASFRNDGTSSVSINSDVFCPPLP